MKQKSTAYFELGKRVKQLRQNAALPQQKFADCTGFYPSYIQKFEERKRNAKEIVALYLTYKLNHFNFLAIGFPFSPASTK